MSAAAKLPQSPPKAPSKGRQLAGLHGPKDLETDEQKASFVDGVTDGLVDAVHAERKRQGLRPLT